MRVVICVEGAVTERCTKGACTEWLERGCLWIIHIRVIRSITANGREEHMQREGGVWTVWHEEESVSWELSAHLGSKRLRADRGGGESSLLTTYWSESTLSS